jgi:hypothetical protein
MRLFCTLATCVGFLAVSSVAQDGTASLAGRVQDITNAGLPGTLADLKSETFQGNEYQTRADAAGIYSFSGLPAGEYTLKLLEPGFSFLTVKSITMLEGEKKSMPLLQLSIPTSACNGISGARLDYVRPLPSRVHGGDLRGSVRLDQDTVTPARPIAGANVTLLSGGDSPYRATTTDSGGEFIFDDMDAGQFAVRVTKNGFYPLDLPPSWGYWAGQGLELMYGPVFLEACPRGDCSAPRPPRKIIGLCA